MKSFWAMVKRNTKLFFYDKGMFFTSLITPMILIVLFVTFLGKAYRDSLISSIPEGIIIPESVIEAFVGGWLFSSLLAVCCVTVAFCSNMLMVQDKVTGAALDIQITPVKTAPLAGGYYVSTAISTLIICGAALCICFIYLLNVGWYLTLKDIILTVIDVFLLVMLGTALSSLINFFLKTQGQISAVGTIVSSGYGFICGAYMPISQFSPFIRKLIAFLPGTYGTSLLRNHLLEGPLREMEKNYLPYEAAEGIKEAFDSKLYLFGVEVTEPYMYLILVSSIIFILGLYLLFNFISSKKHRKK